MIKINIQKDTLYKLEYCFSVKLTIVGWALPYSWPGCKELAHTGPVASWASLWEVWRGRRQGLPAWWLQGGSRARGSSWISPHLCPHFVEWTPGRLSSLIFRRKRSPKITQWDYQSRWRIKIISVEVVIQTVPLQIFRCSLSAVYRLSSASCSQRLLFIPVIFSLVCYKKERIFESMTHKF